VAVGTDRDERDVTSCGAKETESMFYKIIFCCFLTHVSVYVFKHKKKRKSHQKCNYETTSPQEISFD
jgi:hypothetical protein